MTHTPRHYALALFEALYGKNANARQRILSEFMTVLNKNHQHHLVNQILVQYEKVFLIKNNIRKVDIESVSPISETLRDEIEKIMKGKILLTETIRPELIAGMTLTIDDTFYIDASARTEINNLFR
jgi:F0F1-type ATP synthase delta subunit